MIEKVMCPDTFNGSLVTLGLDEACLHIHNTDVEDTIQLWLQSQECYRCSMWPLASLSPGSNGSLVVNTTYTTLFNAQQQTRQLYGFSAHFSERGWYELSLNSSHYSLSQLKQPDHPYMALLYAALFYLMLFGMWQLARFLRKRMDEPNNMTVYRERTPILQGGTSSHRSNYGLTESVTSGAPGTSVYSRQTNNSYPVISQINDNTAVNSAGNSLASYFGMSSNAVENLTASVGAATDVTAPSIAVPKVRLRSLDVFRGITIFLMIFVNYGGGKYYFFLHSPWNGLTVADLVFPWFMWIMGVSMIYSLRSQLCKGVPRSTIVSKIMKRSLVLFLLGLLVNGISNRNVPTLRIPGVLQRFSACYLLTSLMEALIMTVDDPTVERWEGWFMCRDVISSWFQWSVVIGLACVHTLLTFVLPVPGCPRGYVGPGGLQDYSRHYNCTGGAAAYIDKLFFTANHLYPHSTATSIYQNHTPHDPEGILGVMTSMVMVQLGAAVGRILVTHEGHKGRVIRLLSWALSCGIVAGVLCDFSKEYGVVPVNKNLWSLSYVLATACFAFAFFAIIYSIVDWSDTWNGNPARYAGLNAILLYVGHELTKKVFPFSWTPVGSTHGEHLLMNIWGTTLWGLIAYICHRKKLYISL